MPIVLHSQATLLLDSATQQSNLNLGPVPFDSYLEELILSIHTAVTVSNTGISISLGNTATTGEYITSLLVTATTTGVFRLNLTATTVVLNRNIPAGKFLKWSVTNLTHLSSTAVISIAAVLVPRTA